MGKNSGTAFAVPLIKYNFLGRLRPFFVVIIVNYNKCSINEKKSFFVCSSFSSAS